MQLALSNPEEDFDAQAAIWRDTRLGASILLKRWNVRFFLADDDASNVLLQEQTPVVGAGKLVEMLSVVALLQSAESVPAQDVRNLRGSTGPVRFVKDGVERFLWVQPTRLKGLSGWGGRPDLLVTTADRCELGTHDFVIECKHVANLKSGAIRAEFGKGFDLGVKKYHIWSFYEPALNMVDGAGAMGIELSGIGFDPAIPAQSIAPRTLLSLAAAQLDRSDRNAAFARALQRSVLQLGDGGTTPQKIS